MDVPFVSSGAISRAQYALVRKVESSDSTQSADHHILVEVATIRQRLAQSTSTKQCKEYLIILLYCWTSISTCSLDLDFALPFAVNLAEAGRVLQEKRIGYLFCTEVMPVHHELQLMLVNTIRKDLESSSVPQICLALDTLIASSTPDVVPAVQGRLHDLLSHNSSHVRQRAIFACRALSRHEAEIMERISGVLLKRIQDPQSVVASAAHIAIKDLLKVYPSFRDRVGQAVVTNFLSLRLEMLARSKQPLILNILDILHLVELPRENMYTILKLLRSAARSRVHALIYGVFGLLCSIPWDTVSAVQTSSRIIAVDVIRHLLTSHDVNEQYLFLSCLEFLDPRLWAGTMASVPAVLEGWEVEKVMQFLDSSDILIRKKTLKILHRTDADIVETYYSQCIQAFPGESPLNHREQSSVRLLEIIEIQCSEDGECYAQKLKVLLGLVDGGELDLTHPVSEKVVENVLNYIRQSIATFRIGCVTSLLTSLVELDTPIGSTFMVILCALATEFCGLVSLSPSNMLQGFSSRLTVYSPTVQEACVISMLRITADVGDVPAKVSEIVTKLGESSGRRHIRRRCKQFLSMSGRKPTLLAILGRAHSPTLPGFVKALETQDSNPSQADDAVQRRTPTPSGSSASSSSGLPSSKLRYEAYESPKPVFRFRDLVNSGRSSSRSTVRSDDPGSSRSPSREKRRFVEDLSKTVSAGDLALATGTIELEMMNKLQVRPEIASSSSSLAVDQAIVHDSIPRSDLIVFDSPSVADHFHEPVPLEDIGSEFERLWHAFEDTDTRGWCGESTDVVVRRLQGLALDMRVIAADRPPFDGDLKLLMTEGATASRRTALRLKDSEEDGCLWRLRSNDTGLRTRIKHVLADT